MKVSKLLRPGLLTTAVALAVSACGGDDPKEEGGEGDEGGAGETPDIEATDTPSASVEAMAPDAAKAYLDDVALEVINMVRPTDQETLVRLASECADKYADYEAPTNWDLDDVEDHYYAPSRNKLAAFMGYVAKAAKGDAAAASRASNLLLSLSRFSGVYYPGSAVDDYGHTVKRWVKSSDSDGIQFNLSYKGANDVIVTGIGENGSWSESYDNVTYQVPSKFTATVTYNGTVLAKIVSNTKVDFNAHTLSANVEAALSNVNYSIKVSGTNSRISSDVYYWYNGKQVAYANAIVDGSDMVDRNAIENLFDKETETYTWGNYTETYTYYEFNETRASNMFHSATAESNILNKVRVAGSITGLKDILNCLDEEFGSWEYDSQEVAKAQCQANCNVLNKSMPTYLYLAGSANSSASVTYQPIFDDWGYRSWEWYVEPVLSFSDGSTYSIESYFEQGFGNLESPLQTIVDTYEKFID
jgi:hypothetical protein